MSDTPRTAKVRKVVVHSNGDEFEEFVPSVHAEQLEVELAEKESALDLMRDEFLRIRALCTTHGHLGWPSEIAGLCDRAVSGIKARVTLIELREEAEKKWAAALRELAASEKALGELNQRLIDRTKAYEEKDVRRVRDAHALMARIKSLEVLLDCADDELYAPERNCSCHISPPCNDCVNHGGVRGLKENIKAALAGGKDTPS